MADDITPGELSRRLADLTDMVRGFGGQLAELVRRDVYEAHRTATEADLRRLEAKTAELEREAEDRDRQRQAEREQHQRDRATERAENRRMVWTAVLGSIGAALAAIVSAVVVAVILR